MWTILDTEWKKELINLLGMLNWLKLATTQPHLKGGIC